MPSTFLKYAYTRHSKHLAFPQCGWMDPVRTFTCTSESSYGNNPTNSLVGILLVDDSEADRIKPATAQSAKNWTTML